MPDVSPQSPALARMGSLTDAPTALGSRELAALPPEWRRLHFFSAKVEDAHLLAGLRKMCEAGIADGWTEQEFIHNMRAWMESHFSEDGHAYHDPDDREGWTSEQRRSYENSVRHIDSIARLRLIFRTQASMGAGYRQWSEGYDRIPLKSYPGWRFYRRPGAKTKRPDHVLHENQVRLKTDIPYWLDRNRAEIGGFNNPFPPFGYNSWMWLAPVSRAECERLGLLKPGEKLPALSDEFRAKWGLPQMLQASLGERSGRELSPADRQYIIDACAAEGITIRYDEGTGKFAFDEPSAPLVTPGDTSQPAVTRGSGEPPARRPEVPPRSVTPTPQPAPAPAPLPAPQTPPQATQTRPTPPPALPRPEGLAPGKPATIDEALEQAGLSLDGEAEHAQIAAFLQALRGRFPDNRRKMREEVITDVSSTIADQAKREAEIARIRTTLEDFAEMCAPQVLNRMPAIKVTQREMGLKGRYSAEDGLIEYKPEVLKDTIFHEFTHHIHAYSPQEIFDELSTYFRERCRNTQTQYIRFIRGAMGKSDHWAPTFNRRDDLAGMVYQVPDKKGVMHCFDLLVSNPDKTPNAPALISRGIDSLDSPLGLEMPTRHLQALAYDAPKFLRFWNDRQLESYLWRECFLKCLKLLYN